jgi:hypothetical protein
VALSSHTTAVKLMAAVIRVFTPFAYPLFPTLRGFPLERIWRQLRQLDSHTIQVGDV